MNTSICPICKNTIIRRGSKPPRFCSVKCKSEWQRSQKPVTKDWLYQKYIVENLSTYDIGKIVNRDSTRVYDWLIEFNIPTRPRGENLKNDDRYKDSGNNLKKNHWSKLGIPNPFLGKTHSAETKRILSEKASIPKPYLRGNKNGMFGRSGKDNPSWNGGGTPERQSFYASSEWGQARRDVWNRDKGICQRCGTKLSHITGHHIHHIVSFSVKGLRADPNNLILFCGNCHRWVHSRENTEHQFIK